MLLKIFTAKCVHLNAQMLMKSKREKHKFTNNNIDKHINTQLQYKNKDVNKHKQIRDWEILSFELSTFNFWLLTFKVQQFNFYVLTFEF